MSRPVTETVHFSVNLRYMERDGKHIALTAETGIITVGGTKQEATESAARWNQYLISETKQNGRRALKRYLDSRGVRYQIGSDGIPQNLLGAIETLKNTSLAEMAEMLNNNGNVEIAA